MGRKFWQASCKHCGYVTGPYYEDEWRDAEEVAGNDVEGHIIKEHSDES